MALRKLLFMLFYMCGAYLLGCGAASAQQRAVVERDAQLLTAPQSGAAVVGALKQGTSAEVIVQKGTWVNLRTDAGTGWTNSYNVRFLAAGVPASKATVTATPARRSITPTIGIRGLDEEDLRQAHYDEAQMRLLDSYAASKQDGLAVAATSGLSAVRLDYFDKK
jgi:hypothetical protein